MHGVHTKVHKDTLCTSRTFTFGHYSYKKRLPNRRSAVDNASLTVLSWCIHDALAALQTMVEFQGLIVKGFNFTCTDDNVDVDVEVDVDADIDVDVDTDVDVRT